MYMCIAYILHSTSELYLATEVRSITVLTIEHQIL